MMDKTKLKKEGLEFGRSLQRAYKLVSLFSADHTTAEGPLKQAYASLNSLLKQTPQLTFGFSNRRVALNDLLTIDPTLEPLEAEFFKRDIGSIRFQTGITFREFKQGLGLLATKPELIEQSGGIAGFLKKNPVGGMRIRPSETRPGLTTVTGLGVELETYITAQSILETQQGTRPPGLDLLLQIARMQRPTARRGTAGEMRELSGTATPAGGARPESDPKQALRALAQVLEQLPPDQIISALPPGKQTQLRGRPAQEVVSELVEDAAIEWAKNRLSLPEGETGKGVAEEEVVQALRGAFRTAPGAERLLQKLGRLAETGEFSAEATESIRKEVLWSSLAREKKHAHLMSLERFTPQDFRHLVEYLKETEREGDIGQATPAAGHYLACVYNGPPETRAEGLARLPEVLRALASLHTLDFVRTVAEQFRKELLEEPLPDWPSHQQIAHCLASAAQSFGLFEDFETVLKIGADLERSYAREKDRHAECCGHALKNLVAPASVERLVELFFQKRGDPNLGRIFFPLLRFVDVHAAEILFKLLEEEKAAPNRVRLLQVLRQLGEGAFLAARKRLTDERWYVVRNACNVLGDLNDPDLAAQLAPALRHPDGRVQQAAINAFLKSKVSGRGEALAKVLPALQPNLQETVLNELLLMKDPATITPLQEFILGGSPSKAGIWEGAIQALVAIPDERAVAVLSGILLDSSNPLPLRKAALSALKNSPFPSAREQLAQLSRLAPSDPLAKE